MDCWRSYKGVEIRLMCVKKRQIQSQCRCESTIKILDRQLGDTRTILLVTGFIIIGLKMHGAREVGLTLPK